MPDMILKTKGKYKSLISLTFLFSLYITKLLISLIKNHRDAMLLELYHQKPDSLEPL